MANLQVGVAGNGTVTVGAGASVHSPASNTLTLGTNGDERLRIDSSGRVKIGGTAVSQNRDLVVGSNAEANLAIETHNDATSESSNIRFFKSGNTGASPQIVEAQDNIARLQAYGYDGTDYNCQACGIDFAVDGTPGSNDMPGRIVFKTTADGASSPTERLRITSAGHVLFSGVTSNVDTRNIDGITLQSPAGISLKSFGSNGSRNWRIRPDDMGGWADLDFSCAPTDGSTDIPDAATDIVLSLQGDTKDVVVKGGNLVIGTSGKGIDFSATSGSGTSELLDDYEEGTWTPVLAGTTNHTLFNASGVGTYTRVGRHVHCQLAVHNVDLNDSAGGQVMIKGLPFTEYKGGSGAIRCLSCNFMTNNAFFPTSGDMNRYSWYINDSNYLVGNRSDDGGGWVAWNVSNFMASSLYIDITFSYIVAT